MTIGPRRILSKLKPLLAAVTTALVLFAGPASALADEYEDYTPTEVAKDITAPTAVLIAYAAIWLLVCAYAVALWLRQRGVGREIEKLERRLDDMASGETGSGGS